ncbi:hypothetical protein DFR30_1475 [Thiogranum longum]|uniref:Tetratricopeptide repeat protein n=1 Tax=Thiogranum longum TaxID=1537524 RepID=A0A4R1HDH6_9GAMM|nr:hypothetical protein [Thiogranum longum]TCK18200.1 hypothetical protein DFR30_1475 [Thiogranum longum]
MKLDNTTLQAIDPSESVEEIRKVLAKARKHLRTMPDDTIPVDRARALLDVAEPLLGLGQGDEAWQHAREAFSVFVDYEQWQDAVETADILYQCEHKDSISALGQGIWLAVTYPVRAQSTVALLDHVIDETPVDSDGAAVAAMAAHYIVDLRTEGEEKKSLGFLTTQMIARVAKRQRGIEDQETLNTWIEMYKLNDVPELFKRLALIVDVLVGDSWWFDRDALREKLPVN